MTHTPPCYITNEQVITPGTSWHPPVTGYPLLVTRIVFRFWNGESNICISQYPNCSQYIRLDVWSCCHNKVSSPVSMSESVSSESDSHSLHWELSLTHMLPALPHIDYSLPVLNGILLFHPPLNSLNFYSAVILIGLPFIFSTIHFLGLVLSSGLIYASYWMTKRWYLTDFRKSMNSNMVISFSLKILMLSLSLFLGVGLSFVMIIIMQFPKISLVDLPLSQLQSNRLCTYQAFLLPYPKMTYHSHRQCGLLHISGNFLNMVCTSNQPKNLMSVSVSCQIPYHFLHLSVSLLVVLLTLTDQKKCPMFFLPIIQ